MKELSSLAEASGGRYFVLDDYDDPAQIAEEINAADFSADYIAINIPPEEKDGTRKEAVLSLAVPGGTQTLSCSVEGLTRTAREEAALHPPETETQEEELETPAAVEETVTEKGTESAVLPAGTEENVRTKRQGGFFINRYRYLVPAGVLTTVLTAGLLLFLIRRFRPGVHSREPVYDSPDSGTFPDFGGDPDRAGDASGPSGGSWRGTTGPPVPDDSTVSMWGVEEKPSASVRVILEDTMNPKEQYEFLLTGETVVGRSRKCDVVIAGDPSVSKRHLRLTIRQGGAAVEDLSSMNGTFINGIHVSAMQPIHTGDILGIGNRKLRVYLS